MRGPPSAYTGFSRAALNSYAAVFENDMKLNSQSRNALAKALVNVQAPVSLVGSQEVIFKCRQLHLAWSDFSNDPKNFDDPRFWKALHDFEDAARKDLGH